MVTDGGDGLRRWGCTAPNISADSTAPNISPDSTAPNISPDSTADGTTFSNKFYVMKI